MSSSKSETADSKKVLCSECGKEAFRYIGHGNPIFDKAHKELSKGVSDPIWDSIMCIHCGLIVTRLVFVYLKGDEVDRALHTEGSC